MVNPPKAKMRCQRKSGFQESRRERVAQINETVEVGFGKRDGRYPQVLYADGQFQGKLEISDVSPEYHNKTRHRKRSGPYFFG